MWHLNVVVSSLGGSRRLVILGRCCSKELITIHLRGTVAYLGSHRSTSIQFVRDDELLSDSK